MESMSEWKEKLRYLPHNLVGHLLMRLFQLFGLWGYQSGYTTRRCPSNLILVAAHGYSRKSEPLPLFCHKKGPKFLCKTCKSFPNSCKKLQNISN